MESPYTQSKRNGFIGWLVCIAVSLGLHVVLIGGGEPIYEKLFSMRHNTETEIKPLESVRIQIIREQHDASPADQETKAVLKTSREQESATRPEIPQFESNRNTRAEGGRLDPSSDQDLPTVDGEEREELVLFNQNQQAGDLKHEETDLHNNAISSVKPILSDVMQQMKSVTQESLPMQHIEQFDHSLPRVVTVEQTHQHDSQSINYSEPVVTEQQSIAFDPMFSPQHQPGFKTWEKATKQNGKFSFGRRPTLDVEATPLGEYQTAIYRAIGAQWYRQCDLNRDLIVTGTVKIQIFIDKKGRVSTMRQISRVGAGEAQKSFTFLAIKQAVLPPMPQEVQERLVGEVLEMYFDFNF